MQCLIKGQRLFEQIFTFIPARIKNLSIRHGYIKSISFEGGRLSGQRISFSASLNTVIGIRGSGKSSLLEVVRYALSLFPSQDADYKNDLVKHVLGDGGKISMTVIDEHGIEYHIERIYGERPVVLTAEGKVLPIAPNVILKNPLYFGQKDLSMSKPGYEFELLNKLVGGRINKQEEKLEQIVSSLQITLRQYAGIRALPERIRELEDKDKEYDHKLQVFKEQISEREFAAIAERIEADYESLIENQCPDMVHIYYHGKELGKHSMGQRASALMLFILSQDDNEIIIIDQPEDDLDNQVVYTEFIKTLKQKKTGIQFIFATHNANIPVLGDTERLIAAQYTDSNIGLTTGNIDTPLLQRKIVEIMEGGFEAFQRRNAIYTSWR